MESKINFISFSFEDIGWVPEPRNMDRAEVINKIFSNFTFNYFDFYNIHDNESAQNEDILKKALFSFLDKNKFICYQIINTQSKLNISSLLQNKTKKEFDHYSSDLSNPNFTCVFCVEKQCFIFDTQNDSFIRSLLNGVKAALVESSLKDEQFLNLYKYLFKVKTKNFFICSTFCTIATYLIERFSYPSNYFEDKSFFAFDSQNNLNDDYDFTKELASFGNSKHLESFENMSKKLKRNINKKINSKIQLNKPLNIEFKTNELVELKTLSSSSSTVISKVLYIKTLNIFVLKKKANANREIEFNEKYFHRCFTKFYGFIKDDHNKISGFVYEYMSQGTLHDYVIKNKTNSIFVLSTILRMYQGLSFLQSNNLIHRDIRPHNILIDRDNVAYISDFDTVRKLKEPGNDKDQGEYTRNISPIYYTPPEQDKGLDLSLAYDIYSFAKVIYFIYERKKCTNDDSFYMTNSSENIQLLIQNCIKKNPEDRLSLLEIRQMLIDETNSDLFIGEYFVCDEKQKCNEADILHFFTENLLARKQSSEEIEKYIGKIKTFYTINFLFNKKYLAPTSITNDKLDKLTINKKYSQILLEVGDIFYKKVPDNFSLAEKYYKMAAEKGNSNAFLKIGMLYKNGEVVKKNYTKARENFEKALEKGNYRAANYLGDFYFNGLGVEQDDFVAKYFYELAAEHNDSDAQLKLGNYYKNGIDGEQDYIKAKEYYELSAKSGNSEAFLNLGIIYENGLGTEKDFDLARYYYKKAAKSNNIEALLKVGNTYQHGIGVFRNQRKAKKYYELAAKQGSPEALLNLGIIYEYRENGIKNDYTKAKENYELSAEKGNTDAMIRLGDLFSNGKGVEQNVSKAIEYYEKAKNLNNSQALLKLEDLYSIGKGVEKNYEKGMKYRQMAFEKNNTGSIGRYMVDILINYFAKGYIEYFLKFIEENANESNHHISLIYAFFIRTGLYEGKNIEDAKRIYKSLAKQKNGIALFQLGLLYNDDSYPKKNISKSIKYLELSAEQNNSEALLHLGMIYENGIDGNRDFKKAKYYYERAAKFNNPLALLNIGDLYKYGNGVEQNFNEAKKYYELSMKQNCPYAMFELGEIYFNGYGVEKDVLKAIEHYKMAANKKK